MEKDNFKAQLASLDIVEVFYTTPADDKKGAFAMFAGYGKEYGKIKSEKGKSSSISGDQLLFGAIAKVNEQLSLIGAFKTPFAFNDSKLSQIDLVA